MEPRDTQRWQCTSPERIPGKDCGKTLNAALVFRKNNLNYYTDKNAFSVNTEHCCAYKEMTFYLVNELVEDIIQSVLKETTAVPATRLQ